jgi:hypothetical protein
MTFPQTISPGQANPETPFQEDLRALQGASVYGRRDEAISGLTWGYHGGHWSSFVTGDGTQLLGASTTTYMVIALASGAVSFATSTTNWDDDTTYRRGWKLTTSGSGITGFEDWRFSSGGVFAGGADAGAVDAADVTYTPATPADWDGSADPGDTNQALDQLAERVTDVEGMAGITALTGDVTASGSGSVAATIANDAVTNAKMANVATQTIKGRTSGSTGDPEDLTAAQAAAVVQGDGLTTDLVGYRGLPQITFSANVTIDASHNGKDFYHPASDANARTVTIDANATLALPIGFTFSGYSDTSQAVTIGITTDTLVFIGTGATGSRSVAQYGSWVARKVASTRWTIGGVNIT